MANYKLSETQQTDIQTTFRFEIYIHTDPANTRLGLTRDITGYIQRCDLPSAPGSPIIWHLPGGMQNHQAGKRQVRSITTEFVVSTKAGNSSIYSLLETWAAATYDLNTGTNIGKANYCTDGIWIRCKGEDDVIKYEFRLRRAQVTECSYGSLSSESNDLLRVSASFIYDWYEVYAYENGTPRKISKFKD